jgi:hypothetical protein
LILAPVIVAPLTWRIVGMAAPAPTVKAFPEMPGEPRSL